MGDINNITITGHLARDAEQKSTAKGNAVLSFTVANTTGYGDNEKTNWFNCALFGKRAEGGLAQYMTKGKQVTVQGEVTLNEYEKDGVHKANLQMFVTDVKLQGVKQDSNAAPAQQQEPHQQSGGQNQGGAMPDDFADEIPFLSFMRGTVA